MITLPEVLLGTGGNHDALVLTLWRLEHLEGEDRQQI